MQPWWSITKILQMYVFKRPVVTLVYELSAIKVDMKLLQPKTTANISCSILAYLVSAGVRLLDANATGLLLTWLFFCMSTAPSPTFDAFSCSATGMVVQKYYMQASLLTLLFIS